jgi:3-hydroxyisobutyrate dehydrogenase-like beta-hydroxyacid dehydrogenase
MGAGVAHRLSLNGATVLTSLAGRSAKSAERAAAADMRPVEEAAIARDAAIILSIVPPAEARSLAERLAPHLAAAATKPLYVDCNAVSPETVKGIAEVVAPTGCPFVDGGIIGGPPRADGYTPKLYVSGAGAERLSVLSEHGLDVRMLTGPVGAASALKMSYAGITKGLVALASAMALASSRAGAAEGLFRELEQSQPQLLAWFRRMVPPSFDKAYRWEGEMEEIADFIGEDRAEAGIYRAVARFYAQMATDVAGPRHDAAAISAFLDTPPTANSGPR